MKNIVALVGLLLWASNVLGQNQVDYNWTKIKADFSPLTPLPVETTYRVKLPDSLHYLLGTTEVLKSWGSFGLQQILIKRDEKSPATNYTFKFDLEGLNLIETKVEERPSNTSTTKQEFFRHYLYSFPAKLIVIDNTTKQIIQTVTVTTTNDTFVGTLHKNLFITDSFDPNYQKVVGFDSLSSLARIPETDSRVLRFMEMKFATVLFEKMKEALIVLYGKSTLKVQLGAINPKAKNRVADYSDYDANSNKILQAYELLNTDWNSEAAKKILQEAELFYEEAAVKKGDRFQGFIPMITHMNLAQINLLQGDFEKAETYYQQTLKEDKLEGFFESFAKPNYLEAKNFLELRQNVANGKIFSSTQKGVLRGTVKTSSESSPLLSIGYIITNTSPDTVSVSFKNFEKAKTEKAVVTTDSKGVEKTYEWKNLRTASTEGIIYKIIAGSPIELVYVSSSIEVYFMRPLGQYIYSFPATGAFGGYKPFSADDASNYLTNYNKQLSDIFKGCPEIAKKINEGFFKLKSENNQGHIKVIGEFEALCGKGDFENIYQHYQPEKVKSTYR